MRWLLVLMLTSRVAFADDGDTYAIAGLGTSMSRETTGWALRVAGRLDAKHSHIDDEPHRIGGGIVGIEAWGAGDRWGLSFPTGGYIGVQAGTVRTTLGCGVGMYAIEKRSSEEEGKFGIAPFASATVEKLAGDLVLVFEGTIARQVIVDRDDHNVYSVMLLAGRRFPK